MEVVGFKGDRGGASCGLGGIGLRLGVDLGEMGSCGANLKAGLLPVSR